MKKVTSLTLSILIGIAASAQQLPNYGFESWKSACDNSDATSETLQRPGVEPTGWNGSSVNQNVKVIGITQNAKQELVFNVAHTSENDRCAQLKNIWVGKLGIGSVAPGYLTLGTPWVYATSTVSKCDGGTYGGTPFTKRPDALSVDLKRVDSNDENTTIVAYLWSGTFSSKIGEKGNPGSDRDNVDRAILGMDASATGNGKLIANLEKTLKSTKGGDWETVVTPFNYRTNDIPTMANVIICGGDYWERNNLQENTELLVDNAKFIYYSRLATLKVNNVAVTGFNSDKFEYTLDQEMPTLGSAIGYTHLGKGSKASVALNETAKTATVTVTNDGGDTDGKTSHVYTLKFTKEPAGPVTPPVQETKTETISGRLDIKMVNETIAQDQAASIQIIGVEGASTCTFLLPNFSITLDNQLMQLGDIRIDNVTISEYNGSKTYRGHVDNMLLGGGEIIADVDLSGTISPAGIANMTINVGWKSDPTTIVPIVVTFTNEEKQVTPPGPGPQTEIQEISGYLTITMLDEVLAENQAAYVQIIGVPGEKTCTFLLPNFSMILEGQLANLGNIRIENVAITEMNGVKGYRGDVKDMLLGGGEIIADVHLYGTIKTNGDVDMNITVDWKMDSETIIPVEVVFTNKKASTPLPEGDEMYLGGYLDIEMMGDLISENQAATVMIITPAGSKTCTFLLKDFTMTLDGKRSNLGDIRIDNVTITDINGIKAYRGQVKGMKLANGEITADVMLSGTLRTDNTANMTINVDWLMDKDTTIPILVKFKGSVTDKPVTPPSGEGRRIAGRLFINLMDTWIDENGQAANIKIINDANGNTCTFLLPDFTLQLDADSEPVNLGDIRLENVTVSNSDPNRLVYDGHKSNMELGGGEIIADVDLHGDIIHLNEYTLMEINVGWKMDEDTTIPIKVYFTNRPDFGVGNFIEKIETESTADPIYYNLSGIRVNPENITPGIYILITDRKAEKVFIR